MPSIKNGNGDKSEDRGLKMVLKLNKDAVKTASGKKEKSKVAEIVVEEDVDDEEEDLEDEEVEDPTSSASQRKKRRKKKFRFSAIRPRRVKKEVDPDAPVQVEVEEKSAAEGTVSVAEVVSPPPLKKVQPELSSFQLLLDQLLRLLERKDKDGHFRSPVTDEIAPGYSIIVSQPMDFSTIRQKIFNNEYRQLIDFRSDVLLVFSNAETYNQPGTVYFQTAKIMQTFSYQLFSKEKLQSLAKALPFIADIPPELMGFQVSDQGQNKGGSASNRLIESINDDMLAAEILTKSRAAAKLAADKLAVRQPNSKITFFRQHEDGSTTLNFLNDRKEKERKVTIGELIGDLKEGTPGISLFTEDKRNVVVPVSQLDYGPFSSFAPRYDSTWATLSKEDSKLLLQTYGDQTSAQYAQSLQAYVQDSNDYVVNLVDGILDTLTNGSHSTAFGIKPLASDIVANPVEDIDFESMKSVSALGIDTSFLDQIEGMLKPRAESPAAKPDVEPPTVTSLTNRDKLKATGQLLKDLAATQNDRVSQPPPFLLTEVAEPAHQEIQLASQVISHLQSLMPLATPADVSNVGTVRSLMGVERPKELVQVEQRNAGGPVDIDMDILHEFLRME